MAGLTHIGSSNVRGTFTNSNGAIMTRCTGAGDLRMIHARGRYPRRSDVTGLTHIGACNMAGWRETTWTSTNCRIMTGRTGTDDLIMINKSCRCPGRGIMAGDTVVSCRYVRRGFSNSHCAIMATLANTIHL